MRIVLKLGTSTLTHPTGNLNIRRVEEVCKVCSDLKNAGHELVLVSSGAVAMGVGKLSLAERPKDIPGKQAASAVSTAWVRPPQHGTCIRTTRTERMSFRRNSSVSFSL